MVLHESGLGPFIACCFCWRRIRVVVRTLTYDGLHLHVVTEMEMDLHIELDSISDHVSDIFV